MGYDCWRYHADGYYVGQSIGGALQRRRNSSIELLRILSMFLILAHHFLVHNAFDYTTMPVGVLRLLLQLFLESGGKIAVAIFFIISVWFFLEKEQTVKGCFRRVWFFEKEVFFYSVALGILFFLFCRTAIGVRGLLNSFMPLTQQVWWYASAYAFFLFFLPFLECGLKALGRQGHLSLCLIMLLIYGVFSLIPGAQMVTGVYSFVYMFVLVAAYRWYIEGRHDFHPLPMIALGMAIIAVAVLCSMGLWDFVGKRVGVKYGNFVTDQVRLPVLLVAFGVFLLFQKKTFYNKVINLIAGSAFAVYLITDYPSSQITLWQGPLNLGTLLDSQWGFFVAFGFLMLIYFGCTAFDLARRQVFKATVDRFWGDLFEALYSKARTAGGLLLGKLERGGKDKC